MDNVLKTLTAFHVVETLRGFRLDCCTDMDTDDETTADESRAAYDAALLIAERLGLKHELLAAEQNYVDSMMPHAEGRT